MKSKYIKWMGLALLIAQSSGAKTGTERGNGGDVVVLPDDRVVLADEYIQRAGDRWTLPPQLIEELKRIEYIIEQYAGAGSFVSDEIFHPYVEYRLVDSIPIECSRIPLTGQPTGSRTINAGCSVERRTYLVKDLIKRMSIRELAKLVFHERIRAARPEISAEAIYDFSVGIETALNLHNDQLNHQFASSRMNHESFSALNALRLRLFSDLQKGQERLAHYQIWSIWQNGGGLVATSALSRVDRKALITLSAKVSGSALQIANDSIVQGSTLRDAKIGAFSVVENSLMDSSSIESHTALINSELSGSVYSAPGSQVRIESSKIHVGQMLAFTGPAQLVKSAIISNHAVVGSGSVIRSSTLTADEIRIGEQNQIEGLTVTNQAFSPSFPLGFKTGNRSRLSGNFPVQPIGQWLKRDKRELMPAALTLGGFAGFGIQMAMGRPYYATFAAAMAGIFWGLDASSEDHQSSRTYKTRAASEDPVLNEVMRSQHGLLLELGEGFSSNLSARESVCEGGKVIRLRKYARAADLNALRELCRKEK